MEELRKTAKNVSQYSRPSRKSNPEPHEYEDCKPLSHDVWMENIEMGLGEIGYENVNWREMTLDPAQW
jgi:hypothetical protein